MVKLTEYQEQTLVQCYKNADNITCCEAFDVLLGQCYVGSDSVINSLEVAGMVIWVNAHVITLTPLGRVTATLLLDKHGNYKEDFRDVEP